jgi:hypothetical protein
MKKTIEMKTAAKTQRRHPVSNVGSVFRTRRDLLRVTVSEEVLGDCKLSMELVEILVDLNGAIMLGWSDPKAHYGHVTFRDLLETAVHGSTFSDATLSLRLKRLNDMGLILVKPIPQKGPAAELRSGPRGSRSWVRITEAGVKVAAPIWKRYKMMAERLAEGAPAAEAEAHYRYEDFLRRRTKRPSISYEESVRELEKEEQIK